MKSGEFGADHEQLCDAILEDVVKVFDEHEQRAKDMFAAFKKKMVLVKEEVDDDKEKHVDFGISDEYDETMEVEQESINEDDEQEEQNSAEPANLMDDVSIKSEDDEFCDSCTDYDDDVEVKEELMDEDEPVAAGEASKKKKAKATHKQIRVINLRCSEDGCEELRDDKAALLQHLLDAHQIEKYRCFVRNCGLSFADQ